MKRVAILVISALNQPVYQHYLSTYWTDLIRYTNEHVPHIDVFLLKEHRQPSSPYQHLVDHVIEDPRSDFDDLLDQRHCAAGVPSVLSKTMHALDVLGDDYDVFFRTNLSSMVMLPAFDRHVQSNEQISYSGAWVWTDALRNDLVHHGRVGPERAVRSLDELAGYPGNTFVSGSGFFLNADEARTLVSQRGRAPWSFPDDVAVGLMLKHGTAIRGFAESIDPEWPIAEGLRRIESTDAAHIRLTHFPVERARALWRYLERGRPWE